MQDQRVIQGAFVVSLLLHILLAAATWRIPLFPKIDPAALAANDNTVAMIILPPKDGEQSALSLPKAYTEIPDRQASETPPDQADYLATHHSLAADNVLGGDTTNPSAEKEWISDQVQIKRENLAGANGVQIADPNPVTPPAPNGVQPDLAGADQKPDPRSLMDSETVSGKGQWALADPSQGQKKSSPAKNDPARGVQDGENQELEKWWEKQDPSILRKGQDGASGDQGFDFDQAARGKVSSGVAIDGDFSLNTYEWDYAPWMHRFTNELYRHWVPPYAYKLGILTGHTVIKLVIGRDGVVKSLDVQETEGHESLHEASVAALRAFAPYAPLPAHFPEENLVITLGLYYPALQR